MAVTEGDAIATGIEDPRYVDRDREETELLAAPSLFIAAFRAVVTFLFFRNNCNRHVMLFNIAKE